MKLTFKIFITGAFGAVMLFPALLSGQSAGPERTMENTFTAQRLLPSQLQTFRQRANQKIGEFAGYVDLISNPELDADYRAEAVKAASRLFYDNRVKFQWAGFQKGNLTLRDFLEKLLAAGGKTETIEVRHVQSPVSFQEKNGYTWDSRFVLLQKTATGKTLQSEVTMEVVLKRISKQFGDEKKEIWEVFLGEVKKVR